MFTLRGRREVKTAQNLMFEHNRATDHLNSDPLKYISLLDSKVVLIFKMLNVDKTNSFVFFNQENGATTDKAHARLASEER